jgi:hypothetical protein
MPNSHRLTKEKAEAIAAMAALPVEMVREWCLAHWPTGEEHQRWLDAADPGEIAVWIDANAADPPW